MKFSELISQASALLREAERMTYRALKREFALDDETLDDLKEELIVARRVARDEDGKVLVWIGEGGKGETAKMGKGEEVVSTQPPAAERRHLTVMFCDVVDSTALSARLDPEDLRDVIRAFQEHCTTIIQRYDGHVAQHLGDGLLVYFGYPTAHEDAAARAVRAGLEIVTTINDQQMGNMRHDKHEPLQVRVGVHTGVVVIGEMGSTAKREMLALGETPNLAARIQGVAVPNTVAISGTTQRLVHGLFECQDGGLQSLKGIAAPVSVYRVTRESTAQSRFEVVVGAGLTPLVGREEELGLLQRRWAQAKDGAGQVVLLSGEAGIGKSRLVQMLKEQVTAEGATRIEFRCSPYHQNSAFAPIIDHLQRLLQFQREDTPHDKLSKLQHALTAYRFPQADTLPLLAVLLSLPHPDGAPPVTLSPQKQKEKTQAALVAWIMEEAQNTTVYCAWEDLHWADPSTLEVLTLFLEQIPTARVFSVLTCRPEFVPPWSPRSYLTHLTLNRLGRAQVETLVNNVSGGKALPAEVLQQIVRKTDGVPLFIEELTKMVLESGLVREEGGHYVPAHGNTPIPPLAIPSTLHDSLMARLDRLAPVREIAQIGAVLGREFSYELLQAVSAIDDAPLQQGLQQLRESELIFQRGVPPQATYLFKHALVQDTAYQSLLKSKRQQLHQQIAHVVTERFLETVDSQPELLAHHYTEAGLTEQAISYWQQAGDRARERSANVEAISHFTKGLALLKTLPDTPTRDHQELVLQIALGDALIPIKTYTAPEVEQTYTIALELCRKAGEVPQLFSVLFRLALFSLNRAELQRTLDLSEQLMQLAKSTQDEYLLVVAHMAVGCTLALLGEFVKARPLIEQARTLYDPQKHPRPTVNTADPRVDCLCYLSWTLLSLGYPDQGLRCSQEAVRLSRGLSHPFSLAYALGNVANVLHMLQKNELAQVRAEELITLSTEQGFPYWVARGIGIHGAALVAQGRMEEGIAQLQQSDREFHAMGAEVMRLGQLPFLASAYTRAGRSEEGLRVAEEALVLVDKTGMRVGEAGLYVLKGWLLLSGSSANAANAEACFQRAVEIARQQQAKLLELNATMGLARLWQQQGKKQHAHHQLSEIYNWFTEGFDTKDLQEAKALLAELAEER